MLQESFCLWKRVDPRPHRAPSLEEWDPFPGAGVLEERGWPSSQELAQLSSGRLRRSSRALCRRLSGSALAVPALDTLRLVRTERGQGSMELAPRFQKIPLSVQDWRKRRQEI